MNAAPLTTAQLSAMQENVVKWNKKLETLRKGFTITPEKQKACRDSLMESHFANLPHYVLD